MRAWLMLSLFLGGCGTAVVDPEEGGSTGSTGSTPSTTSTSSTGAGTMEPQWPRRTTLIAKELATASDGVRLADGTLVESGGDLTLLQTKVLSLRSPTPESICVKGTYDALGDIPSDLESCAPWSPVVQLSAASVHTSEESYVIGLGVLVWDKDHTALYRLRVVGDSYDRQGMSTATFDYEPVP